MATVLIGTAIGATSAARVTAVRPRAGAGARAFAFGANNAVSPSRVAGLGRRGTVRVAVRASLSLETVREEKPEARVVSEDAHASASRGEALKQVQTRPSNRLPPGRKISPTWSAFALFEVCRASTLTVRHPRLPSFHAVRTTRRARRRCHGLRAGFPLCVSAPAATPSAPRSNLQLARSLPSSYRRFRVFARHITLRRGDDTAGPHANAHRRGARRFRDPPREPRLGSGSRGCARGRVRSRESGPAGDARSNARARENRAREDSGTPVARARETHAGRSGR